MSGAGVNLKRAALSTSRELSRGARLALAAHGVICAGPRADGAAWRGGRAVEGARLESVYTGNRIAGSNPAPSANSAIKSLK